MRTTNERLLLQVSAPARKAAASRWHAALRAVVSLCWYVAPLKLCVLTPRLLPAVWRHVQRASANQRARRTHRSNIHLQSPTPVIPSPFFPCPNPCFRSQTRHEHTMRHHNSQPRISHPSDPIGRPCTSMATSKRRKGAQSRTLRGSLAERRSR